jgi:hypothetical protein
MIQFVVFVVQSNSISFWLLKMNTERTHKTVACHNWNLNETFNKFFTFNFLFNQINPLQQTTQLQLERLTFD